MPTPNFIELSAASAEKGEHRDCAVKALALCCGVDYDAAHAALKAAGRKDKQGTFRAVTWRALKALGYERQWLSVPDARTMTSLPAAMKARGCDTGRYMVFVRGHVAAFVDGVVEDWTNGRRHHIKDIYRIVPKGTPELTPVAIAKAALAANGKVPGVQVRPTRAYYAGQIVAKYGLDHGVTEDMVAELDKAYGKPNPTESRYRLKDAWHALRGAQAVQQNTEQD